MTTSYGQPMTTQPKTKRKTMSQVYYQGKAKARRTPPISKDIFTTETHRNPLLPLPSPSPIHPLSHQEVGPWPLAKTKIQCYSQTEEIKFGLL